MSHQQWDTSKTVKSKGMKLQWGERWWDPRWQPGRNADDKDCGEVSAWFRYVFSSPGLSTLSVYWLVVSIQEIEQIRKEDTGSGGWLSGSSTLCQALTTWDPHGGRMQSTSPVYHLNFTHSPCDTHRYPRLHTGTPTINKQTNKCNFLKKKEYTWSLCGN